MGSVNTEEHLLLALGIWIILCERGSGLRQGKQHTVSFLLFCAHSVSKAAAVEQDGPRTFMSPGQQQNFCHAITRNINSLTITKKN